MSAGELLLTLVNRSLAACWLIFAILLLRPLFRKVSPAICCALWSLVAIRLLCPFTVESVFSLIPNAEPIPAEAVLPQTQQPMGAPLVGGGSGFAGQTGELSFPSASLPAGDTAASATPLFLKAAVAVWIAGIAALAVYLLVSYLRLHLRAREAVQQENGYWLCEGIASPFVLGVFRPRILLPYSVEADDIPYILAHERAHLARRDHWRKPIGFALFAIFWFQPFLWLAYFLLCRDIEFACDERAIRSLGADLHHKKCYAEALLRGVSPRISVIACPVAFGGLPIKRRVESVLRYRKPAMLLTLAALIVCAAVAVCFLSNPVTRASDGAEDVFPESSGPASAPSEALSEPSDDAVKPEEDLPYPFYGTALEEWSGGTIKLTPHAEEAALAELFREALNADTLSSSEQTHLPLFRFDSREAWEAFAEAYGDLFIYEAEGKLDTTVKPESFFQEKSLIAIYAPNGMASRGWGAQYRCDGKWVQVLFGSGKLLPHAGGCLYFCSVPRNSLSLYPAGFDAVVSAAKVPDDLPYDPIDRLEELQEQDSWGTFPYLEGVISGEIDPTAPKLDEETARAIIASYAQEEGGFERITEAFRAVQLYPDWCGGSGFSLVEYWFGEDGDEGILIIWEQQQIFYYVNAPDGSGKHEISETLFNGRS